MCDDVWNTECSSQVTHTYTLSSPHLHRPQVRTTVQGSPGIDRPKDKWPSLCTAGSVGAWGTNWNGKDRWGPAPLEEWSLNWFRIAGTRGTKLTFCESSCCFRILCRWNIPRCTIVSPCCSPWLSSHLTDSNGAFLMLSQGLDCSDDWHLRNLLCKNLQKRRELPSEPLYHTHTAPSECSLWVLIQWYKMVMSTVVYSNSRIFLRVPGISFLPPHFILF